MAKKSASKKPTTARKTAYVPRQFHEARPIGHDGKKWVPTIKHAAPNRNTSFEPLPPLTANTNLHLDLASVLPPAQMSAIQKNGKLVFHLNGDVGGIQDPHPQQIVADHMEIDITDASADSKPSFMYLVGDIVYFTGQAAEYFPQFYQPYQHYPAPIFAIPGNHDGELVPGNPDGAPSLDAFMRNFCSKTPVITSDAGEANRTAMTQPYCYWTLDTPFATFVGIYTNVPEGGEVQPDQQTWFTNELKNAPKNKALIFSLHHPIYSLDVFHAGSQKMLTMLETAFTQAKRTPDIIFSGHVHNYQRFTRLWNGQQVPCIVAGNGGYHNLHAMSKDPNGNKPSTPETVSAQLTLESYDDTHNGFMRLEVDNSTITASYYSVPRPNEDQGQPSTLVDNFVLNYKQGKYAR